MSPALRFGAVRAGAFLLGTAVVLFALARLAEPAPRALPAALDSVRTAAELDSVPALEKSSATWVGGPGDCGLGTFIKAAPCRKDVTGAACCGGLKLSFHNKCACR
jgi:hypothetical protein